MVTKILMSSTKGRGGRAYWFYHLEHTLNIYMYMVVYRYMGTKILMGSIKGRVEDVLVLFLVI